MRLHAAEVVEHQHVGGLHGVLGSQSHRSEDLLGRVAHLLDVDDDLVGFGDLEALKHGAILCRCGQTWWRKDTRVTQLRAL